MFVVMAHRKGRRSEKNRGVKLCQTISHKEIGSSAADECNQRPEPTYLFFHALGKGSGVGHDGSQVVITLSRLHYHRLSLCAIIITSRLRRLVLCILHSIFFAKEKNTPASALHITF